MDEKQLEETVRRAATNLFEHQPNMFDFTSETNQTEWNLAHHLAVEIHQFFPDLDCDVDVIKVNLERKRPDIILHRRGGEDNFVVIEVKRDGDDRDKVAALAKTRAARTV